LRREEWWAYLIALVVVVIVGWWLLHAIAPDCSFPLCDPYSSLPQQPPGL